MTETNHIQAFLDYMRTEVDASPMTIQGYSADLWAFLAYTEERLGEPFVPSDNDLDLVRSWLSHRLDTGSKASSVGKYLASLKSYYRYLLRHGIIRVNPIQALRPPKADKPLPVYVPTAELNRLIDEPAEAEGWRGIRDQLLLMILYECGLRRSELAGLLDRDVDTHTRQLKVLGKGRKERIVPFGEGLAQAIEAWRAVRNELFGGAETLLVSPRGKAMSPQAVYQVAHQALSSVPNLSRRGAHALRHSFATDMLNSGSDLMLLRELLGHNSVSTTVRYTHTSFEQLKQVYAAHPRSRGISPPDTPEEDG